MVLLSKAHLRKDIDYVLHLFACDIEIVDNVVVYFLTKSFDGTSSLSLTLLTTGYNGSFRKIRLLANYKNDLNSTNSLLEINSTETPEVLQRLENKFYKKIKEEDWKLR